MIRNFVLLVIFVTLFPMLAQAKKPTDTGKPEWVDNPKKEYPESMYLSAVGSGGSRAEAESNASANLAKVFRSEISATTSYRERYNELMSSSKSEASTETQSQKNVQIKAKQNLFNIEISKTCTDKLGQVYAIAYLHRLKTADIYEEKIEENNALIRRYLSEVQRTTDVWKIYALYNIANVIHLNNEELLAQLAIISLDTKQSIDLGYDPQELKLNLSKWSKDINFYIVVSGDSSNETNTKIYNCIAETIAANGWSITDVNAANVDAKVGIEDVELAQAQKFVRYNFAINVHNPDGILMLSLSDNGREGHINKQEANARALRTMVSKIKTELPKKLNAYFDNMVIAKK
jgi:hypothetical protein